MSNTFTHNETFVVEYCCECGVAFGISRELYNECLSRGRGRMFYCPNGHGQHYTGTEAERLKEELATVKQKLAWEAEQAKRQKSEADYQARRAAAARGLVTKLKNKAAKGECPCCGETFPDLHKHIAESHPEFIENKDSADEVEPIAPNVPLPDQVTVTEKRGTRVVCPHCQRDYKNMVSLRSHIYIAHKGVK